MFRRLKIIVFPFLICFIVQGFGQANCYQTFYQKGKTAFQTDDYEGAINNFKAAKVCPDKPSNSDVDDRILEAQNGFINAIQKERKRAQSLALTAKSILELQKNDNATTAFRYAQYALEKDDNSESRSAFYEAAYQLESENKRLLYSKSFKAIDAINEHIKKVDFSPNGKYITVFSSDWMAQVYDLEGIRVASRKAYYISFDKNAFSADDQSVAFVGDDGLAYIYDFPIGSDDLVKFRTRREDAKIESMCFSPNGKFIAIGYRDGLTQLFKTDGTFEAELKGFDKRILSLSFSNDDSLLVTGNDRGEVTIWNTDGKMLDTISVPKFYDTEVIISPDKRHLLVSSSKRRVRLLTIDGQEVFRAEGYFWDLTEYNFSVEGEFVSLGNSIYNLSEGNNYGNLIQTLPEWVKNIHFSKNNRYFLASGYERNAQVWKRNYNEWTFYGTLGGHHDAIASTAFSPDGENVITASYDMTVKIWPIETIMANAYYEAGKLLRPIIMEDSTYAVTHKGKDVYLWNAETGYHAYYGLPVDDIITLSEDGKLLFTVEKDMVNIWKFDPTGEGIEFRAGISAFHPVQLAKFSKNKKAVAMFLRDDVFLSLSVWDIENQKTRALGGGHGNVSALEWTPDGSKLLIGNYSGEVIVWNYKTPLDQMTRLKSWNAHERQPISHIAVSPDGNLIATASWDNTAKLWSADFEYLTTLRGHIMEINSVEFSPDNQFIITTSEDRSAKIWDTKGQLIVSLEGYPSDVKRAYFSPNQDYVVTNYGDGLIKIWPFNPALIESRIKTFTKVDLEDNEKEKYGIK